MNGRKSEIFTARKLAECGLFVCVITVCSWITLPIFAVPYTLQTFAIALAVFSLGTVQSLIVVGAYILLGMAGAPVFAGFNSGFAALAGPTGGFIIGFFITAALGGTLVGAAKGKRVLRILAMCVGMAFSYVTGVLWFHFVAGGGSFSVAFTVCVAPFIIPDIIKIVLAELLSSKLPRMGRINKS